MAPQLARKALDMAAEGEIERDVRCDRRAVEDRAAAEARSSACGDVSHTYSRTSSLHKRRVTVAPSRGRRPRRERARAATSRTSSHHIAASQNDTRREYESPSWRRRISAELARRSDERDEPSGDDVRRRVDAEKHHDGDHPPSYDEW